MRKNRDDLLAHVLSGSLEPEEAEIEARRLGLAPLLDAPNPVDFDPLDEPDWSLLMTLAWIITRDLGVVRQQWDAWREKKAFWEPVSPVGGFKLTPIGVADMASLMVESAELADPSVSGSFIELGRRVRSKELASFGVGGKIPVSKWREANLTDKAGIRTRSREEIAAVYFKGDEVRSLWPRDDRSGTATVPDPTDGKRPRNPRQEHVKRFMTAAYPEGLPSGVMQKVGYGQYVTWCNSQTPTETQASFRTFRRAIGNK